MYEHRGRANVFALAELGSKDHIAGPSQVPLRIIHSTVEPRWKISRWNVGEKAFVAGSWHDDIQRPPSTASRSGVWSMDVVLTI